MTDILIYLLFPIGYVFGVYMCAIAEYHRRSKITIEPLSKKEIREQLEDIQNIVENDVHPAVSPDNWYIYSNLHDEIEQLEILLKQNNVI